MLSFFFIVLFSPLFSVVFPKLIIVTIIAYIFKTVINNLIFYSGSVTKFEQKLDKKKHLTPVWFWYMIAQVMKMNELLKQALLYDFYGELLTEHQKEIYSRFALEDLSLGEIAKETGISRQGVHDIIKRCGRSLAGYEEKLHLVERFMAVKKKVEQIDRLLDEHEKSGDRAALREVRKLSGEIIEEL